LGDSATSTFMHIQRDSSRTQYNVYVYTSTTLPPEPRTRRIESTGPASFILLFDYLAYT
ncbi:hypothetical protein BV20DRAFT_902005, partial [Pilatotrama ljubarskyi]